MNRMRFVAAAVAVCVFAAPAIADISEIGPFTGDKQEGFETQPRGQFRESYDVFGTQGIVRSLGGGQGLHITTGWSFFSTVFPHSGEAFMGGAGVNAEWEFDVPALRFGGYFCTNADEPGAVAVFFDDAGNELARLDVIAPKGNSWTWNGWETDGPGIKRVQIIANNRFGGFIMHDSMEYTAIPAPGALALLLAAAAVPISRRRRRG